MVLLGLEEVRFADIIGSRFQTMGGTADHFHGQIPQKRNRGSLFLL
jgi:hypothetical protein